MELKAKQQQASAAKTLADSYELVQHGTITYIPAHWETEDVTVTPSIQDRIWVPLTQDDKLQLGNASSNILFSSDREFANFNFMVEQYAEKVTDKTTEVFVRTEHGLAVLDSTGALVPPDGKFRPNCLKPVVNTDQADKDEVFKVIAGWLDSEEEAHSLLFHLATCLAPGWSAVKYVLLLGDGRNGKSVLLSMLSDLFGGENVSNVTRQHMAEQLPVCVELNGKLLNVVFDGRMDYVKDSGLEKTLIAGEPGYIRLLFKSGLTRVQTNALFIEALNKEPKTRDKSSALQKRLVRFWFPNVYPRNIDFERHMRSPKMLGAFLSLLLDHYVREGEVVEKLMPTQGAMSLQVDQMWANSPALQFVSQYVSDPGRANVNFVGMDLDPLVNAFMAWRTEEGYIEYSRADAVNLFKECFELGWKSAREAGKQIKKRTIASLKPETQTLLDQLTVERNEDGSEDLTSVVDIGQLLEEHSDTGGA